MSPKRKEQFDPHAPAHGVPETPNTDIGAIQPSGTSINQVSQVLTAQTEYATNSRRIVDGFIKNASLLLEDLKRTRREVKRNQLYRDLQEIYIKNNKDYGKCEPEWSAVIEKAKQDEDFVALENGTGAIDLFAADILTPYRETAIAEARKLACESRAGILTKQITAKQTDLRINLSTAANAETPEENISAVRENIKLYTDIEKLLESEQTDGTPVFSELDKAKVLDRTKVLLAETYARKVAVKAKSTADYDMFISRIDDDVQKLKFGELLGWQDGTPAYKDDGNRDTEFEKVLGLEVNFLEFCRDAKKSILNELRQRAKMFQKQMEITTKRGLVERTKRGEVFPDLGNATYKSAVSEYYTEFHDTVILPLLNNIKNPNRFAQIAKEEKDFISKFRFLPAQMTDFLQNQFEYGQPQSSAMACDVANYVYSHRAGYVVYADPSYLRNGGLMLYGARLYDNGTPPETVQELVKKIKNVPKSVIEERAKMFANPEYGIESYGKNMLFKEYNDFLNEFQSSVKISKWTSFPNLSADLVRDFMLAYETIYESCGDMKSSAKAAIGVTRRKWGVTKINGEISVAPYAIEDRLGTDIFDAELARKRAWEFACEHAKLNGNRILPALDSVKVEPDAQTEKEIMQGKLPTYAISYTDEYGDRIDVDNKGTPFRFSLYAGLSEGAKLKMGIAETDAALQQNRLMTDKIIRSARKETRNEMFSLEKLAKAGVPKSKAEKNEEEEAKKKGNKKEDTEDKK